MFAGIADRRGRFRRGRTVAASDGGGVRFRPMSATACPRDIPESIPRTVATVERLPLPARSIFAADGLRVPAACDILSRVARFSGSETPERRHGKRGNH